MHVHDALAQLYLLHEPTSYARMLRRGARYKYHKVHRVPTVDDLDAHLAGDETIAVPLIGAAGLSYHVALDVDHDGIDGLHRALARARARGWTAYAITSVSDTHTGGHVWLHLDQPVAPKRAYQLAATIAQDAHFTTVDLYPTQHSLRLPFGMHRWTHRRGQLLLQDGTTVDLDAGVTAVRSAIATVATLPCNTAANLPPLPTPTSKSGRQTRQERPGATNNPIQAYNHTTDLIDLLESYGAHIAEQHRNGSSLLHCPCGQHQHGDAQASLEVRPARNTERYGSHVAIGHAPGCRLYAAPGQVMDSFRVYCHLEGLTVQDALALSHTHAPEVRS